jgi:hypothetical protein
VEAPFSHLVTSEVALREVLPPPAELSVRKEIRELDGHCRDFIARSPFAVLATANAAGDCDVSPRGGPAGFCSVLDERRLAVPEFRGNRRADSMLNLLESPRAALLFLIPGLDETLRVNGRAWLTRDPDLLAALASGGRPLELAIGVEAEQVFIQCAKAFKRSGLWEADAWPSRDGMASVAEMLRDHMRADVSVEAVQAGLDESYAKRLY